MVQKALILIFCLLPFLGGAQSIGEFISIEPGPQIPSVIYPETHRFQYLIQTGDPLTTGGFLPPKNDFTGFVPLNGSSEKGFLGINSENWPGGMTILDVEFNPDTRLWDILKSEVADFSDLGTPFLPGTINNCSGGVTPWGTLVTCEENALFSDQNGDGHHDFGWVIEVDPVTRKAVDQDGDHKSDKIWAMGHFKHENATFTPDMKVAYEGEDEYTNGFLFKYVMDIPGNLASGQLFVLQITDSTGTWIPIPNQVDSLQNQTVALAKNAGGTPFYRIEDVETGPDSMVYFASTQQGHVFRFKDEGNSVSGFEIFVKHQAYEINYAGGSKLVTFSWPDNLAFDCEGNLWVTQDGDGNHVWVIGPNHSSSQPDIRIFCNSPKGSEPTGITFSPDCRFLFMSFQHPLTSNGVFQYDASGDLIKFDESTSVVFARKEDLGDKFVTGLTPDPDQQLHINFIFPNPAHQQFQTLIWSLVNQEVRLRILDDQGRVMQVRDFLLPQGSSQLSFDISDLHPGVYLLEITNGEGRAAARFVKIED
ncbi:MAG: DUF839 domain-containing protein [Bacteroidia bacterium]|nr:DUF839 domain-containing protein [Bacteroidia bacterium]